MFFRTIIVRSLYCMLVNSFGAIVFFRELSPAIFWRPQNIIKHALYGILALYSLNPNPNLNPNQNQTHVPRYLLVWNLTDVWPLRLFIFFGWKY